MRFLTFCLFILLFITNGVVHSTKLATIRLDSRLNYESIWNDSGDHINAGIQLYELNNNDDASTNTLVQQNTATAFSQKNIQKSIKISDDNDPHQEYANYHLSGYYRIGDYAQTNGETPGVFVNWHKPYGPLLAIRDVQMGDDISTDVNLLNIPNGFKKVWDSQTLGSNDNVTIWSAYDSNGEYIALGHFAVNSSNNHWNIKPDANSIRLVHNSCVTQCYAGALLWSSVGSTDQTTVYFYEISSIPANDSFTEDDIVSAGTFFATVGNDISRDNLLFPCLIKECVAPNAPEQVHLATSTDNHNMRVNWVTKGKTATSTVRYGKQSGKYTNSALGTISRFVDPGPAARTIFIHDVNLYDLEPNTIYYYQCGDSNGGWSIEHTFRTIEDGINPVIMGVYGDLGFENSRSVKLLRNEIDKRHFDMILHVGDFAYDMQDDDGVKADHFMRMIEPIAANVPYMVCPGNHEFEYNFTQYNRRFSNMPFNESGSTSNWYYSWDYSFAHILSFSTEVYYQMTTDWGMIQAQYNWIEQDLQMANKNRKERPWIIVMGHRPMYCSDVSLTSPSGETKKKDEEHHAHSKETLVDDYTDCTLDALALRNGLDGRFGIEELFFKYGVDLYLTAHEHSYERLWPVYQEKVYGNSYVQPAAPIHIINGAAGNRENLDGFNGPEGPWSAFRSSTYGYGIMTIHNATHLSFIQIEDGSGSVIDTLTIVQDNHGPFNKTSF